MPWDFDGKTFQTAEEILEHAKLLKSEAATSFASRDAAKEEARKLKEASEAAAAKEAAARQKEEEEKGNYKNLFEAEKAAKAAIEAEKAKLAEQVEKFNAKIKADIDAKLAKIADGPKKAAFVATLAALPLDAQSALVDMFEAPAGTEKQDDGKGEKKDIPGGKEPGDGDGTKQFDGLSPVERLKAARRAQAK